MTAPERTQITYRYERLRAVTAGVLESAGASFLLLIALRWFEAGATIKGIVAGGASTGLLLSPVTVSVVGARGWRPSRAAAALAACGAVCYLAAAVAALPAVKWLWLYAIGAVLGATFTSIFIPLLTQMYHENYPEPERGQLFSRTVMIRIAAALLAGVLGGKLLDAHISNASWLLLAFAAALAGAAFCLNRCPTHPLHNSDGSHPFRALKHAWHDKIFQRTLIVWMLMGFANLMMLPMRIEYLGNPRYGLNLSSWDIALLTLFVPNVARLILSPVWGRLFDRMNFFALRATLNAGFGLGILAFFTSDSTAGLYAGAIIFGISNAGGDVAWSLWVTKFSPPDKVAEYMSVHTFFTGVRGVLAPIVAFQFATGNSMHTMGWVAAGMITLSVLILLPEMKWGKRGRRASPAVEEVSE
ncbi:MAG: MFS transporter [Verrucomicrobia bacterium]|nr:MFS transporter [Verrucomicrobiota bacterium]